MTEEQFTKRLTEYEKDRLRTCAYEMGLCVEKGAFSFMDYWAHGVSTIIAEARERMAAEDAGKVTQ